MEVHLTSKNFRAGSPYSCWLRECLYGELMDTYDKSPNRGLFRKYHVKVNKSNVEDLHYIIMDVRCMDELPSGLRKVAADIIRMELDPGFERRGRREHMYRHKRR